MRPLQPDSPGALLLPNPVLQVSSLAASGLSDGGHYVNTYCIIDVGGQQFSTKEVFCSSEPSWADVFSIEMESVSEVLQVVVMNWNTQQPMGRVRIPLAALLSTSNRAVESWHRLDPIALQQAPTTPQVGARLHVKLSLSHLVPCKEQRSMRQKRRLRRGQRSRVAASDAAPDSFPDTATLARKRPRPPSNPADAAPAAVSVRVLRRSSTEMDDVTAASAGGTGDVQSFKIEEAAGEGVAAMPSALESVQNSPSSSRPQSQCDLSVTAPLRHTAPNDRNTSVSVARPVHAPPDARAMADASSAARPAAWSFKSPRRAAESSMQVAVLRRVVEELVEASYREQVKDGQEVSQRLSTTDNVASVLVALQVRDECLRRAKLDEARASAYTCKAELCETLAIRALDAHDTLLAACETLVDMDAQERFLLDMLFSSQLALSSLPPTCTAPPTISVPPVASQKPTCAPPGTLEYMSESAARPSPHGAPVHSSRAAPLSPPAEPLLVCSHAPHTAFPLPRPERAIPCRQSASAALDMAETQSGVGSADWTGGIGVFASPMGPPIPAGDTRTTAFAQPPAAPPLPKHHPPSPDPSFQPALPSLISPDQSSPSPTPMRPLLPALSEATLVVGPVAGPDCWAGHREGEARESMSGNRLLGGADVVRASSEQPARTDAWLLSKVSALLRESGSYWGHGTEAAERESGRRGRESASVELQRRRRHLMFGGTAGGLAGVETAQLRSWEHKCAIDLAIDTRALRLLSHPRVQRCLDKIWHGRLAPAPLFPTCNRAHVVKHPRRRLFLWPVVQWATETVLYALFVAVVTMLVTTRPVTVSSWEVVALVYLVGFACEEARQAYKEGWRRYWATLWNYVDTTICLTLSLAASLRLAAVLAPPASDKNQYGYLTDDAYDVASLVLVPLWVRGLNLLEMWSQLGELLVVIKRMLDDVVRFTIIWSFFVIGFAGALRGLSFRGDLHLSYGDSISVLMRATFGGWGFDDASAIHPELGPLLLGAYLTVVVILLVNLLIAQFSTSFANVVLSAGAEYNYMWALKVYSYYVSHTSGMRLPVPLNILSAILLALRHLARLGRALLAAAAIACVEPRLRRSSHTANLALPTDALDRAEMHPCAHWVGYVQMGKHRRWTVKFEMVVQRLKVSGQQLEGGSGSSALVGTYDAADSRLVFTVKDQSDGVWKYDGLVCMQGDRVSGRARCLSNLTKTFKLQSLGNDPKGKFKLYSCNTCDAYTAFWTASKPGGTDIDDAVMLFLVLADGVVSGDCDWTGLVVGGYSGQAGQRGCCVWFWISDTSHDAHDNCWTASQLLFEGQFVDAATICGNCSDSVGGRPSAAAKWVLYKVP